MYRIAPGTKRDAGRRWALPDRVFFACGACHILAYAFLERHPRLGAEAAWLRPAAGFTGNHVFVAAGDWVFDYHGYSRRDRFLAHTFAKARRWWPGWDAAIVALPAAALISEAESRRFEGLRLREPRQFLHDALPRARAFLDRYPPPPETGFGRGAAAAAGGRGVAQDGRAASTLSTQVTPNRSASLP